MTHKVGDILRQAKIKLREKGLRLYALEAELLLASLICNGHREKLLSLMDNAISEGATRSFSELVNRRLDDEPISQILGKKEFWEFEFIVSSSVLTPRNDTETIIEQVLKFFPDTTAVLNILDLGTGSGCLAITLASIYSGSRVTAIEISEDALNIAQLNAKQNMVQDRISFLKSNWFEKLSDEVFDIVVCNPPYISYKQYIELSHEVKGYEPKLALTDEGDGYTNYREIARLLGSYLAYSGKAFFEVGVGQAQLVKQILESNNFKLVKIEKDLAGIERCVIICK